MCWPLALALLPRKSTLSQESRGSAAWPTRGPGQVEGPACTQTSPYRLLAGRVGVSCATATARWPGARPARLSCQGKEAAGQRARSGSHSASSRLQRLSCLPILSRVPSLPQLGQAGLPASPLAV